MITSSGVLALLDQGIQQRPQRFPFVFNGGNDRNVHQGESFVALCYNRALF
jgi:hypothetical protein